MRPKDSLVHECLVVSAFFAVLLWHIAFIGKPAVFPVQARDEAAQRIQIPTVTADLAIAVTLVPPVLPTPIELVKKASLSEVVPVRATAPVSVPILDTRGGAPVQISISAIALNAVIKLVGLTKEGAMDVPSNAVETGWYELGPRPGEIGSAVIAGHVEWPYGSPAVFFELNQLKPGDTIIVLDDRGESVSFTVREMRMYDAAADATDVFLSHDGKAHLNIITCAGVWDAQAGQYTQRLIVFTDKVTK